MAPGVAGGISFVAGGGKKTGGLPKKGRFRKRHGREGGTVSSPESVSHKKKKPVGRERSGSLMLKEGKRGGRPKRDL